MAGFIFFHDMCSHLISYSNSMLAAVENSLFTVCAVIVIHTWFLKKTNILSLSRSRQNISTGYLMSEISGILTAKDRHFSIPPVDP